MLAHMITLGNSNFKLAMVFVLDVSQRDLIDFLVSKPFCPVDTKIIYLPSFH